MRGTGICSETREKAGEDGVSNIEKDEGEGGLPFESIL